MKVWLIALIAIVVGGGAGIAIARTEFSGVVEYFEPVSRTPTAAAVEKIGEKKGPRLVVVGGTSFQFDTISYGATEYHAFAVKNEGTERLTLDYTHPSCGACIDVEDPYKHVGVAPGESAKVVVKYMAMKPSEHFDNSAYFKTNDPLIGVLKLDIKGIVTQAVRANPTELAFGTISVTEGASMVVKLLGYRSPKIELVSQQFSDPSTQDFFEFSTQAMSTEDVVAADKHATTGILVNVKIKPGLDLGPMNQVITLHTRSEGDHNLEVRVTGEVVGDITLMGQAYNSTQDAVLLGIVKRGEGKKVTLQFLVKGPHRHDVKMSVAEVDPKNALQVSLSERPTPVANGNTMMHTLNVELLKDAPPMSRVGNAQGPEGLIMIETTHPTAKRIPIRVRFAVE
jgi:hypothetical protein